MTPLSRRALLRGASGVALGLPLLDAMHTKAGVSTGPKRFVVFFTNNGTVRSAWRPSGTETNFSLAPIMQPLAPFKDKLIVLEGINQESSYNGPGSGDPHMPGMAHMLTGTEMVNTGPGQYDKMGGGISVDQHIAQQLNAGTKFASLSFGVQSRAESAHAWNTMSYLGPNRPVNPEDDPVKAFNRIFAGVGGGNPQPPALSMQRHAVLDAVKADITSLQRRLGSNDRVRLEQHLDAVRSVERSIDVVATTGCQAPPQPSGVPGNLYSHANSPALIRAQMDLLVQSLACDLTRVATLQWNSALGGDSTFVWLGHNETHHDMSHFGDAASIQRMTDINVWFAQQLAYLMGEMNKVPEGNGTLLDNTVILWCNELSDAAVHSRTDMPWLLAGSCGGYFNTGRYVRYNNAPHNDLLVSLCNAMDVPTTSFGNPAYSNGPLSNLT